MSMRRAIGEHEPWMLDGLCAQTDPEAFFPEKGGADTAAKKVCRGCPVTNACLIYALRNNEQYGIWGGLSSNERRRIHIRGAA